MDNNEENLLAGTPVIQEQQDNVLKPSNIEEEEKTIEEDEYMKGMSLEIPDATNGGVREEVEEVKNAAPPVNGFNYSVTDIEIEEDSSIKEPEKNNNISIIIMMVVLVLSIVFVIYYYLFYNSNNNDNKQKNNNIVSNSNSNINNN